MTVFATPMKDTIREKLTRRELVFNAWLSLGSAYACELIASAGWEAVTIDQQHGAGGAGELLACLTAARAAGAAALVRVANNDSGLIGRALDAGAQGVVCPMVNSAPAALSLVRAVKYPPLGKRSFGPYRAKLLAGSSDYFHKSNRWTIACAQIETIEAIEDLDDILATPGLDMIYAGPNDLAISLSQGGHHDVNAPEVRDALALILARCREHGVIAGAFANTADQARSMAEAGWQVLSVGTDAGWLAAAARSMLASVGFVN
jgi:4-hydroxy-2-oxoheptanedioate aldolase